MNTLVEGLLSISPAVADTSLTWLHIKGHTGNASGNSNHASRSSYSRWKNKNNFI